MQSYLGDADIQTITAPASMTVDIPYVYGGAIVIPCATVASGDAVTVKTRGVFRLPKVSALIASSPHTAAEALAAGQRVYWDASNSKVTGKALGLFLGYAVAAVADTATEVRVFVGVTEHPQPGVFIGYLSATAGLAIATHELVMFGPSIPAGWIPQILQYDVHTTFESATDAGTIALGVKTDDEDCLKAAVAISNGANPYDTGVVKVPTFAVAGIETAAARKLCAVVAVEALTVGSLTVYCTAIKSAGL